MKQFLTALFVTCCIGFMVAGEPTSVIKMSATNIPTGTSGISTNYYGSVVGSTTTALKVTGEVLGVIVDLSGATSPDVDLDIVTDAGNQLAISRTIFSKDDITADAEYDVRNSATTTAGVDITNSDAPIHLVGDTVKLISTDANKTNINVDVYIILK